MIVTLVATVSMAALTWATWNRARFARWYGFIAEAEHSNPPWHRPNATPMLDPNGYETLLDARRRLLLMISGSMTIVLCAVVATWALTFVIGL